MNLQSIESDIKLLTKARDLIIKTENYLRFNKSSLLVTISEEIFLLEDKRDRQIEYLKSME